MLFQLNTWYIVSSDLGIGWDVARVNDAAEDDFINQAHLSAYDQRAYWIDGMSDESPGDTVSFTSLSDNGKILCILLNENKLK